MHQRPPAGEATSDEELVRRAQGGEREAFGALYDRYLGRVYAYCYRVLGNHEAAEDANAEVFERALTALGPERVLFGTDSGTTAPYRRWLKFQQMRVLEELGLSDRDRDLILRGNAARIFRMDEPLGAE